MHKLSQIRSMYPAAGMLHETADGVVHLTRADAEAQARHLPDSTIVTHKNEAKGRKPAKAQ